MIKKKSSGSGIAYEISGKYDFFGLHRYFFGYSEDDEVEVTLPGLKPFSGMYIEFAVDQLIYCPDGIVYDVKIRLWKRTPQIYYYIKRAVLNENNKELKVWFLLKDVKTNKILHDDYEICVPVYPFYGPNSLFMYSEESYTPRRDCIKAFKQFKDKEGRPMSESHIEKFFRAFMYMLVHVTFEQNPKAASDTGKKPYNEKVVERMVKAMQSTWDLFPDFNRVYKQMPMPECYADQRLDSDIPFDKVGNIILVLHRKTPNIADEYYDEFRW